MTRFDPQRRALFRKIALGISLTTLGAVSFLLREPLVQVVANKMYKRSEEETTVKDVYELLLSSPYPQETYFWGLCMPWSVNYRRRKLETLFNDGQYPGWWNEKLNRFGHWQKDHLLEKEEGIRRIMVLSDSHGIGLYTSSLSSFPQQLNNILKKKNDKVQLVNGAMGGMSLFDLVLKYEYIVPHFKPDDIVFTIYLGNDINEMTQEEQKNHLSVIPEKGFAEMGQVVYEVGVPDDKPFQGHVTEQNKLNLETRTKQIRFLPNQIYIPKPFEAPASVIDSRNIAFNMIDSFNKGCIAQGSLQRLHQRVFAEQGIWEQYTTRIDYCFWRLKQLLGDQKNKPNIYFVILPPTTEHPSTRFITSQVEEFMDRFKFPKGTDSSDLEDYIIKSIGHHLKGIDYKLIRTREILMATQGVIFPSDFHYNERGCSIIAEEVAKQFSF